MHPKDHEKFIKNSITNTYKKAPTKFETSINLEAKNIARGQKKFSRPNLTSS